MNQQQFSNILSEFKKVKWFAKIAALKAIGCSTYEFKINFNTELEFLALTNALDVQNNTHDGIALIEKNGTKNDKVIKGKIILSEAGMECFKSILGMHESGKTSEYRKLD